MTNIYKLLLSVAGASLLVASCTKQETDFAPGAQDPDNCQGVYFPAQTVGGAYEPDTVNNYPFTIIVARTDDSTSTETLTVPVEITGSGKEYIVSLEDIVFKPGQKEDTIKGQISKNVTLGIEYDVMLTIKDNQYASLYSSKPSYLSFSFIVEKWNLLGEGQFMDLWLWDGSYPVQIYQNDGDNNRYRIIEPYKDLWEDCGSAYIAGGWALTDPADKIEFTVLEAGAIIHEGEPDYEITLSERGYVYYSPIKMGLNNPYYGADVYSYHPSDIPSSAGDESNLAWNKVSTWQDNGLPSVVYMAGNRYMPSIGGGWGGYESGDEAVIVVFPGGALTDYTLEVEAGVTENGELPVYFTSGVDVDHIDYCIYEGILSDGEIQAKKNNIGAGTEEDSVTTIRPDSSGITECTIVLDSTCQYTLVAVSFDEKGQAQGDADINFGYVKAGDEEEVAIFAGCTLEKITDKYIMSGYDDTKCLLANLYGLNITSASYAVIDKASFEEDSVAAWADLTDLDELDLLRMNNAGGLDFIVSGLKPANDYVLLLHVGNGYTVKDLTATCATNGLEPQLISEGTYKSCAFYENETSSVPFYYDRNTDDEYYFDGFIAGYGSLTITQDLDSGKVDIPFQPTGITDNEAGAVYAGELMKTIDLLYGENAAAAISYYEANGLEITSIAGKSGWTENEDTLKLALFYYSTESYVGSGLETYVPQASEGAPAKLVSTSDVKWVKADFAPVKAEAFKGLAPEITVVTDAEHDRVIKAASYSVVSVKNIAREKKNHLKASLVSEKM